MKIIFICGSLEPGKDGVGDYIRRLAVELIREGHEIAAISLYDKYVNKTINELQLYEGINLPVFRRPHLRVNEEIGIVEEWINLFNPELLSLQFSTYSFNVKGLPFWLHIHLKRISGKRKWHIMFHELWIDKIDKKSWIISSLQKRIIKLLMQKLRPIVVHTHIPFYKIRLQSIGIHAEVLPLFSNILIEEINMKIDKQRYFTIGFFSQFTLRVETLNFLKALKKEIEIIDLNMRVLLIGGNENRRNKLYNEIKDVIQIGDKISCTGFLTEKETSKVIQECDLGITPVSRHVIGKSGSVIAFLSHGIPVAAPYIKTGFESFGVGFFDKKVCTAIITSPCIAKIKESTIYAKSIKNEFEISKIKGKFVLDLINS